MDMAKTYPELLGEWVQQHKSTNRDQYLVAFLAVRDDVHAALEEGYPVKTIWAHMHETGLIGFSYHTFLNYVNRQLRRPAAGTADRAPSGTNGRNGRPGGAAREEPRQLGQGPKPRKPDPIGGFTFNSTPRKEDLI